MSDDAILIAGGYGTVGGRIANLLAPIYPDRLVIAGRNREHGRQAAAAIDYGLTARQLDVSNADSVAAALTGIGTVISCIDQPDRLLLHAAITRGLRYTDITPHLISLGRGAQYEDLVRGATDSGAVILLGAGMVPGISNVIVRALAQKVGGAQTIETALLLTAADESGAASFDYFLQEMTMRFDLLENGSTRRVRAFSEPAVVEFAAPIGRRRAYLFPFSDQVLYPVTQGSESVVTRLAIEPDRLASVLGLLGSSGVARVLAKSAARRAINRIRAIRKSPTPGPFALRVDVSSGGHKATATLNGTGQAHATAAGTAELARALIDQAVTAPGVWMPDQVIDPHTYLDRLRSEYDLDVVLRPLSVTY